MKMTFSGIVEPVISDTPRDQGNVSDYTGHRKTQVSFCITDMFWDHRCLSDVTGCRKTQVSDCTSNSFLKIVLFNVLSKYSIEVQNIFSLIPEDRTFLE